MLKQNSCLPSLKRPYKVVQQVFSDPFRDSLYHSTLKEV